MQPDGTVARSCPMLTSDFLPRTWGSHRNLRKLKRQFPTPYWPVACSICPCYADPVFRICHTFLLSVCLILGIIAAPVIAHGEASPQEFSIYNDSHVDAHPDFAHADVSPHDDDEAPCHAVTHHHCNASLRAEAGEVAPSPQTRQTHLLLVTAPFMPSRAIAPPTQPPAV